MLIHLKLLSQLQFKVKIKTIEIFNEKNISPTYHRPRRGTAAYG